MKNNKFQVMEIIISLVIGFIIVTYTQDIFISIIYIIPIGIAYLLLSKFFKSKKENVK